MAIRLIRIWANHRLWRRDGKRLCRYGVRYGYRKPHRGFVSKTRVERRFLPLYFGQANGWNVYPESELNPFRVGRIAESIPRVGRKMRGQPWALRWRPVGALPASRGVPETTRSAGGVFILRIAGLISRLHSGHNAGFRAEFHA